MSGSTEMATATEKLLDTVCSFPALLNEEDELPIATRAQVEVELPSHEVIRDFSLKYGISIQVVLETVWAIALKTFTGDENICLASLSQEGSDLITAAVEDDSTLIDVLGVISKNKKHFQDGYAPSDLSCNSGVCFVESTEQIVSNFDQVGEPSTPCLVQS